MISAEATANREIRARLEGSGQTILIADDNPETRALLAGSLEENGYAVMEAPDGAAALESAKEADLLLVALRLPGLDGLEVCRRLRAADATRFLPIIVVTASTSREDRVAAMEAGADDFLSRPVDLVEVLVRTRSMLRIKEQRDASDRLRTDLTSMLVHDLRVPLASVSGFLELIDEEPAARRRSGHIRRALEAVGQIGRIVDDMLDMAVIEAGQVLVHPAAVALGSFLPDLISKVEPLVLSRDLHLDFAAAPDVQPVLADAEKLGRAVNNLLHNALKFAATTVRVSLAQEGRSAVIRIEDDGPGIAANELSSLFRRFSQTASGRSLRQGSGLGLATAKLLVEAQGGRIWAERLEGGIAFCLALPVLSSSQPE